MAQFDVHRLGDGLVIDCQADLLDTLNSRFVVPLLPRDRAPPPAKRLNPVFEVAGGEYVMATQMASAVARRELGEVVATLTERALEVTGALDVLVGGV